MLVRNVRSSCSSENVLDPIAQVLLGRIVHENIDTTELLDDPPCDLAREIRI
jgi:hypothetical protein